LTALLRIAAFGRATTARRAAQFVAGRRCHPPDFQAAFGRVGLPNYNPHGFRHILAVLGEKICRTPEEWKAYSQNFGHTSPMTTFNSYGPVAPHRQAEILNALVLAKPDRTAPRSVRLNDDQVPLILNQLAKADPAGRLGVA
jgi:hypothetical protein